MIIGNTAPNANAYLTQIPNTYASLPNFGEFLKTIDINAKDYLIQEVGQTGTLNFGGFLDTDEWVGDLKSYQLYKTIDRMRTDAIIGAIERGNFLPIEQAKPTFGYDDPAALKDTRYRAQLDFIEKDFSRLNKHQFLHNAITFKPYGFSAFEKIYEEREEDGYLHLASLAPRMAKTAFKWIIDGNGRMKWLIQLVYTPSSDGSTGSWQYKDIPSNKLLLITGWKEGGNFSGRSAYRPFYREWLIKDTAIKQLAITINRVGGGIPMAIVNKDAPESTEAIVNGQTVQNLSTVRQMENAFRKMQGGENSYFVGKGLDKLEMFGLNPGAITSIMDTIKYCDEAIIKAAYQPQLNLGTSSSGSRALGETFENMYYNGLASDAETICAAFNEQVIKDLININFGEQKIYPKLHLELKPDMSAIALTLKNLKIAGLIEGNRDLENTVLKFYGLPETTIENNYQPMVQNEKMQSAKTDITDKNAPIVDNSSELSETTHKAVVKDLTLTEIMLNRKPTKTENKLINLAETASELSGIVKNFSRELRQIIQPLMIESAKKLGKGAKIYSVKVGFGNRIADLYRKYFKQIKEKGASDVKKEIQKQNKKINLAEIGNAKKARPFDEVFSSQADAYSVILENRTDEDIAEYYSTAISRGLIGADIADFIIRKVMDEIGQRYDSAAGKITGSYATAREITADEMGDLVTSKIRSEVMDNRICPVCEREDNTEYFLGNDGEYYDASGKIAPDLTLSDDTDGEAGDVHCEGNDHGADMCRGIYLYSTGTLEGVIE